MWSQSKLSGQFGGKGIPVSVYATVRAEIILTSHLVTESSYLSTRPLKGRKKKVIQFQGRCLTDCVLDLRSWSSCWVRFYSCSISKL